MENLWEQKESENEQRCIELTSRRVKEEPSPLNLSTCHTGTTCANLTSQEMRAQRCEDRMDTVNHQHADMHSPRPEESGRDCSLKTTSGFPACGVWRVR